MPRKSNIKLVVGIGTSAGGLEVLKELVADLSKDLDMSFIIIQHLDPDHDSMLSELLGRVSNLPVLEAEDGTTIEPNHIYTILPNTYLEVKKGKLKTSNRNDQSGIRKSIDYFFKSLADEYGRTCAGIVFSGAGSDGTWGLRAIKAAGGLTIAQDPKDAQHSSMPRSAIMAGVIDKIANVNEISHILTQYSSHSYLIQEGKQQPLSSQDSLMEITTLLKTYEDFDLTQYKPSTIQRRIARRMSLCGIEEYEDYLTLLRNTDNEREQLTKDLLINVTDFFRNPPAFEFLKSEVLNKIVDNLESGQDLRIWVSGCATGEEAYSLAILATEALEEAGRENLVQIFATDIDEDAINIGRAGVYPSSLTRQIPEKYLTKYFEKVDEEHYHIKRRIRDCISFALQNIVLDPPFSRIDLVSCRNLLIYLKRDAQAKAVGTFFFALNKDGYLFLGTSESIGRNSGNKKLFKSVSTKWHIYQKKSGKTAKSLYFKQASTEGHKFQRPKLHTYTRPSELSRGEQLRWDLLNTLIPPTVVIGKDGQILYNHGELKPYFRVPEGEPLNDFYMLVLPELRSRIRSAVYKTRKSKEKIVFHFSERDAKEHSLIRVETKLLEHRHSAEKEAVVISFMEDGLSPGRPSIVTEQDKSTQDLEETRAMQSLELELVETKEELQNTIEELETSTEELKASHEEALSTNEELQSINEELEASSEELRSLNEELKTVNDELKEKLALLQDANNDVNNFITSANIPTIFLNTALEIKRFTPAAEVLLKMSPRDLDQPIATIAGELINEEMVNDAQDVLNDFSTLREEVSDSAGRIFIRQITPYRTEDRRIDGVVIVFQDITEIKQISQRAEDREKQQATVAKLGILALSSTTVKELMDRTVGEVMHTMKADYCKILKYQPEKNNLLLVAGSGWKHAILGKTTVPSKQSSQGGYTLIAKEPVIVERLQEEKRFSGPKLLIDHDVTSGISCAINHSDPPFGVLSIHTRDYRRFTQDDANFMLAVSNLLSVVIKDEEIQEQLSRSEENLRNLANTIPQLTWITDSKGWIFWYNERWFEFTGTNLEQMKGWGWQKVHHPDHVDRVTERWKEKLKTGDEWEDTFPLKAADGNYRWFLSRARPIKDSSGKIVNWFGTNTDITEQLETENALFESEQKLRIAKDSNKLGAFEYYINEEKTEWDDLLKEIWGLEKDEKPTQKEFWKGIHPDDVDGVKDSINRSLDPSGDGHYYGVYRVINKKTGYIYWVEASGQVIFDDDNPVRMIGMIIDITERKELEESLQKAIHELELMDEKKNEFLGTLGHELRNPLAAINGGIQLLQMEDSASKELDMMLKNVDQMSSLLDDLLDLTRIGKGKVKLNTQPVELNNLLEEIVERFRPVVAEKNQSLKFNGSDDPLHIMGDPRRLEQIVLNLLSNAHKFTEKRGKIYIRLSKDEDQAVIRVMDNGIGLTPEAITRIFEPFEQVDIGDNSKYSGLGIGLSLVKQFTTLQNGQIEVISEGSKKGTEFILRFPVVDVDEDIDAPQKNPTARDFSNNLKVLIVDDNEDALVGLRALLQKEGCDIQTAITAKEALDNIKDFQPQVYLLDIGLPDMSGYELIKKIKVDHPSDALFIALSGYGHLEAQLQSKKSGFDYHLNKPIKINQLIELLNEAG